MNYEKVFNKLVDDTQKYMESNNVWAMILGISGGIDSTLTAAILKISFNCCSLNPHSISLHIFLKVSP